MKISFKRLFVLNNKVVFIAGLMLVMIGTVLVLIFVHGKQEVSKPIKVNPAVIVNQSSDKPSEAPVSPNDFVQVPADQPREINLPTINASGYIQKVEIDQKNSIAVPSNIHLAGWFTKSVRPGNDGLSIIDGHVSGWYADGIFKRLSSLKAGDEFSITYGDNSSRSFKVAEVKTLSISDTTGYLFLKDQAIKKQLNLITCGGNFDKTTNQYEKRVIVKSKGV